jgi:hypothetical protein
MQGVPEIFGQGSVVSSADQNKGKGSYQCISQKVFGVKGINILTHVRPSSVLYSLIGGHTNP